VNIVVRWPALKNVGLEPASPVDLRVAKVQLQRALELLAESAEPTAWRTPLAAWEEDGVVIFSTREELDSQSILRLYDVRDLVEADMAMRTDRKLSGGAATAPATEPASPLERFSESMEQLKGAIQDSIDPESWRENGGTVGSIRDFNGQLIISQTPAAHEKIARLLAGLRRM
jgi:hypothetical protein